jgi:predicted nuclease of predicted toxin-antitoxin system
VSRAFLIDAQLPRSLCGWIEALGDSAVHVSAIAAPDASDDLIWTIAKEHGLTIVSKDEDFPRRVLASDTGPAVVWVRLGNQPNLALRAALEPIWPQIYAQLDAGERLLEIV